MPKHCYALTHRTRLLALLAMIVACATSALGQTPSPRRLIAHVAAIDQPFMLNRLGAAQPAGMIFALQRDIVASNNSKPIGPGNAILRSSKRPRPIVLRMNVGDTLTIYFKNYLLPYSIADSSNTVAPYGIPVSQGQLVTGSSLNMPATRSAGVHVMGMEMASTILSDGSAVGANESSLVPPGGSAVYTLIATAEGCFLLYSTAANLGGTFNGGQLQQGLFGSLNVEPAGAEYYRSQVTNADLMAAATSWADSNGRPVSAGSGLPIVNYKATYSSGSFQGSPILSMIQTNPYDSLEEIYSDLTAIITGPNAGVFPPSNDPAFAPNPAYPNRNQPYREFSIHYHEPKNAVQAFPVFYNQTQNLQSTLQAGNDNFGINYGTGGIGAEVYANRIHVGPMANCVDCAYEEFFLSSWSVGDPAMVVDVPANATGKTLGAVDTTLNNLLLDGLANAQNQNPVPLPGFKATIAEYPDDPSNVYHSYLGDHVMFRIHHAGSGVTHVHHQHAHQWLRSPDSDESEYLDSQILNPGTSFTLDQVYWGSGNKNLTVGDQIFHCHFYPHFAMGMWAMWRVHDVFEAGTVLNGSGRPAAGARALPDAEIMSGTPIPAIVPLPTMAMAPVPAQVSISNGQVVVGDTTHNPGYPFFIPGVAGSRPPHPPMDFAHDTIYNQYGKPQGIGTLNGGLPRHVVVGGHVAFQQETTLDWTKIFDTLVAIQLPDSGTPAEWAAMRTHAVRNHKSITPSGSTANFTLNGRPPVPGAPYADPAVDMNGNAVGTKRVYKAAAIQLDVVLNKEGWHYPQQRMLTLWNDVKPTVTGSRPPQPFFFRANSDEFVEYWHTNLVPEYYELDNYQVRTPTDIIGQHIHLVKFDVTSSDGAANGFNYEDGTFSPDQVRTRINAINAGSFYQYQYSPSQPVGSLSGDTKISTKLAPQYPNPVWGQPPSYNDQSWLGAQTTIQRWYADPLLDSKGVDRTIRTVFTHDHFGPSTHQQVGLYAGLLVEPKGSTWYDPVTGNRMGTDSAGRTDGGPTSWQANIVGSNTNQSYREFALEFQDLQLAYGPASKSHLSPYPLWNPNDTTGFKDSVAAYLGWWDSTAIGPDWVSSNDGLLFSRLVSTNGAGTYSLNYRNEPIPLRIAQPTTSQTVAQASGTAGDLSLAYSSKVARADNHFNVQPTPSQPINPANQNGFLYPQVPLTPGVNSSDPYTPMLRAYENDSIQIRTLVGAHLAAHSFMVHGNRWLFEPALANSGHRSAQEMSLSEHFEMFFKLPGTQRAASDSIFADYLYSASSDMTGQSNGLWGLMRAYAPTTKAAGLMPLPNNPVGQSSNQNQGCGCPSTAPIRKFTVVASSAKQALDSASFNSVTGQLVYNVTGKGVVADPNALIFFNRNDVDSLGSNKWQYNKDAPVEPLVLRARAGECIQLTLINGFNPQAGDASIFGTQFGLAGVTWISPLQPNLAYTAAPSSNIGLNPALLSYNVRSSDGHNIGFNQPQTVSSGQRTTYTWYAGMWQPNGGTSYTPVPVEYGTINLASSDPLLQSTFGLFGAMVIEPLGATWREDSNSAASANVYASSTDSASGKLMFREFVAVLQNNMNGIKDPVTKAALSAVNYKSSALGPRLDSAQQLVVTTSSRYQRVDVSQILLDTLKQPGTYVTQVQPASTGSGVRNVTVSSPKSTSRPTATAVGGAVVRIQPPQTPTFVALAGTPVRMRVLRPYSSGSDAVFELHGHVWQEEPYTNNSTAIGYNPTSQWQGSRGQLITLNGYELLLPSAGGVKAVPGDYLYRTYGGAEFAGGLWGRMKVTSPGAPDAVTITNADPRALRVEGTNLVNPRTGAFANSVSISVKKNNKLTPLANVKVDPNTGTWTLNGDSLKSGAKSLLMQALDKNASIVVKSSSGGQDEVTTQEINEIEKSTADVERGKHMLRLHIPEPGKRQHLEPGEKPTQSGPPGGAAVPPGN